MSSMALVSGTIEEVMPVNGGTKLVLRTSHERARYPERVVVGFFREGAKMANQLSIGQYVAVSGRILSKQGDRGGWFTYFNGEAVSLAVEDEERAADQQQEALPLPPPVAKPALPGVPGGDDDVPF